MKTFFNFLKWIGLIIVVAWFLGTIVIFLIKFSNQSVSDDIAKWGQMGDYFGGLLNPCLAIMNVALLFYITNKVSDVENERHINQFRHEAYKDFLYIVDTLSKEELINGTINNKDSIKLIKAIRDDIGVFYVNSIFLFEDYMKELRMHNLMVKDEAEKLLKQLDIRQELYQKSSWQGIRGFINDPNYTNNQVELEESCNEFVNSILNFKLFIQKVITNRI